MKGKQQILQRVKFGVDEWTIGQLHDKGNGYVLKLVELEVSGPVYEI